MHVTVGPSTLPCAASLRTQYLRPQTAPYRLVFSSHSTGDDRLRQRDTGHAFASIRDGDSSRHPQSQPISAKTTTVRTLGARFRDASQTFARSLALTAQVA